MYLSDGARGCDLIWWRHSTSSHTAVTLWGGVDDLRMRGLQPLPECNILFHLYDRSGTLCDSWTRTMRPGVPLTVDSRDHPQTPTEGVLAVFQGDREPQTYRRFYGMVDWYSESGELVSLHSDHSVSPLTKPIEFTEIVFLETAEQKTFLVVVNGPEAQAPGSVALHVRNQQGETRSALYAPAMEPFSVHKLRLDELFPGLREFSNGQHATLEGTFDCRYLFSRPYVMTEGRHMAGYHGGDRYQWTGLPRFLYKALGRGELNPMVALHSSALTTTVNLLNSHGGLEDDFWVDARLYNEAGKLVAHRKRWLLAQRHGLSRGDIADLLGGTGDFCGHIALNFSADAKTFYPRRLQALLEYRSPVSTARVMAWERYLERTGTGAPTVRRTEWPCSSQEFLR